MGRGGDRDPPPPLTRLLVPWQYAGPVRGLILDLKLKAVRAAAEPLVDAMAAEVWRRGLAGVVLTWVPARPPDNYRRGFDHAALLAQGLAKRLGLPAAPLLERRDAALDQAGLGAEDRRRNLEHAFGGRGASGPVVLVDDVVTTGATLSACGRALLGAGATAVEGVVACTA